MADPSRRSAHTSRQASALTRSGHTPAVRRVVREVCEELLRMGMPRANLHLAASDAVVRAILTALDRHLGKPVADWFPGEPLVLPECGSAATIVLHDIGELAGHEQTRLLDWLTRSLCRTQVVSTTSAPLFPRVEAGAFDDALYYRLNVIYLDALDR